MLDEILYMPIGQEILFRRGQRPIHTTRYDIMQDKLYQLCLGIRKAFNLRKYPEMLPWEQYLEKSLVPKN